MTDYFVDSVNGNDANAGTSSAAPWRTLTRASSSKPLTYRAGDRILLKRGSLFRSSALKFELQGSFTTPVHVTAYGEGPDPIIDRKGDSGPTGVAVTLLNCAAFEISHIEMRNVVHGVVSVSPGGIMLGLEIHHCRIHDTLIDGVNAGRAALQSLGGTYRIHHNEVFNCRNDGISTVETGGPVWEIDHNEVHHIAVGVEPISISSGDGITCHNFSSGHDVHHNVLHHCRDGIHNVQVGQTNVNKIRSNFIYECTDTGIRLGNIQADLDVDLGRHDIFNNVISIPNSAEALSGIHVGDGHPSAEARWRVNLWNNTVFNQGVRTGAYSYRFRGDRNGDSRLRHTNNVSVRVDSAAHHLALDTRGFPDVDSGELNVFKGDDQKAFSYDGQASDLSEWRGRILIEIADPLLQSEHPVDLEEFRSKNPDSPIIGRGKAQTAFDVDIVRESRPDDAWGIGAFTGLLDTISDAGGPPGLGPQPGKP